tara:strand:+ start:328 stop:501 length:174 start_codon:yes stop_codon:yes gene_type:complete
MHKQTTQMIKDTLGATYTNEEVATFLKEVTDRLDKQAPYFDSRLLDKKAMLEKALGL